MKCCACIWRITIAAQQGLAVLSQSGHYVARRNANRSGTNLKMSAVTATKTFVFGQHRAAVSQFFFRSRSGLTRALTNLKPVVPGHVLVIPARRTSRFSDLTQEEVADLWLSVQRIGPVVQKHVGATAVTLVIQDGAASGQTVDHVHVHVMPRKGGDFTRNDEIYDRLEEGPAKRKAIDDEEAKRRPRTAEEMAAEALVLRSLFDESERMRDDTADV
jgi:bis(5'-adenosyl)-triphosphatase